MDKNEKNKYILDYIDELVKKMKHGCALRDEEVDELKKKYTDSEKDLDVIVKEINAEMKKLIQERYKFLLEFKETILSPLPKERLKMTALATRKDGLGLTDEQMDRLINAKDNNPEEFKKLADEILGNMTSQELESFINKYESVDLKDLNPTQDKTFDEAREHLKRLGLYGTELENGAELMATGKIKDLYMLLGKKYGKDYIIRLNDSINARLTDALTDENGVTTLTTKDEANGIKPLSNDDVKQLVDLINGDKEIDAGLENNIQVYKDIENILINQKSLDQEFTRERIIVEEDIVEDTTVEDKPDFEKQFDQNEEERQEIKEEQTVELTEENQEVYMQLRSAVLQQSKTDAKKLVYKKPTQNGSNGSIDLITVFAIMSFILGVLSVVAVVVSR